MHLNIFVSQKCFLYCKGCYSFSRIEKYGQVVATQIIVDFLSYAYNYGINRVTLCGGDPLTRNDIMDLLKKIKEIGYYISIDTVGTTIIRDVVDKKGGVINKIDIKQFLELVDEIGIPIDGSTNEIFKKFRMTDFDIVFDQLEIVKKLQKYKANICINTVVHKGNLNDAKSLCDIINSFDGIKKWQLFKYAPMGKYGIMNRNLFEISDDEFEKYKRIIVSSCTKKELIQFKGYDSRNKLYMLIDNSGNAWIPEYNQALFDNNRICEERKIIGNITKLEDWDKICKYLK